MLLAMRTASSSSAQRMIDSTGPKISSWAMVASAADIGEHGRSDVVTTFRKVDFLASARHQPRTVRHAAIDVVEDTFALRSVGEGAEPRRRVGRIANRVPGRGLGSQAHHLVVP